VADVIPLKDNIPTDRFPLITVAVILANVIVYILEIRHGGSFFGGPNNATAVKYGAIPYELTHLSKHCALDSQFHQAILCEGQRGVSGKAPDQIPTWQTVFTAMFSHGSFLHIAGNMLFLWIFGNNVEDSMGRIKFIVFYLLGGIAALALQVAVSPNAGVPTIGASGAIAAVLGGYILLYPRARVITVVFIILFFTILELPAVVVLGLWFLEQAIFGAADLTDPTGGGGGVAYFAHVGGFVFGLATIKIFATRVKSAAPRFPVY
jgi:membrane associated rhomboid family serine protease